MESIPTIKWNLFGKYEFFMNKETNPFDVVNALCQQNGIASVHDLEGMIGFGDGTIYKWKKMIPKSDKIVAVADYFNVTTDFILGRESNTSTEETALIAKYRRLTPSQQETILNNIDFLLSQNPVKKETAM